MKKVFIEAYLEKNLGDDLFVEILANRYKNIKLYACSRNYYRSQQKNLKIYSGFYIKVINGIAKKIFNDYKFFNKVLQKKCDYMISIGGSIFIEWGSMEKMIKDFSIYNTCIPYFIIGANYGPSKTNEFKELVSGILEGAEDVCFRDKFSKKLFEDVKNVRVAPDIVFSYDISKYNVVNKKKVVISVIDCERKFSKKKKEIYDKKIADMCEFFIKKEYEVCLMSFCKSENDERAINTIISKCNENIRNKIQKYFYRGDIFEALKIIAESSIVVGSRFHANIIGLLFGKTIIPIAYSNKTLNMLDDINFKGKVIKIDEIEKFNVNTLTEDDLNYKIDISKQKKESEEHFRELDKIFNKEIER